MKRKLSDFISLKCIGGVKCIPLSIIILKNWFVFLLTYSGIRNKAGTYVFRNNVKLNTVLSHDSATIAVVFLKQEYGEIKNKSTIVDIGANIGVFSVYAIASSSDSVVFAYEPMPSTYKLLTANVNLNNYQTRIITHNVGVSGIKEKRQLFFKHNRVCGPCNSFYIKKPNWNCIEVDCITLEDIFRNNSLDKIDLLKIDCEGSEYEILFETPLELLRRVDEIRLEYHNLLTSDNPKYNIISLKLYLERNGFIGECRNCRSDSGIMWFSNNHFILNQ